MALPLHVLFDPAIRESERMSQMMRVAGNLRAQGYEVDDGYGSSLVVKGASPIDAITLRIRCRYIVPVFNKLEVPMDVHWGYRVPLAHVEIYAARSNEAWRVARGVATTDSIGVVRSLIELGAIEAASWIVSPESSDTDTEVFALWSSGEMSSRIGTLKYYPNSHTGQLVVVPTFAQLRMMVVLDHEPIIL